VTVTTDEPTYSAAMPSLLHPLHLLLILFAGWVNRHQLDLIDYLWEENRVLKERRGAGAAFALPARLLSRWQRGFGRTEGSQCGWITLGVRTQWCTASVLLLMRDLKPSKVPQALVGT
jgi:hypothetical protein